jgi:hypothetical protein
MSAIDAHNNSSFTGNNYHSKRRVAGAKAIPMSSNSKDLDISRVSAMTMLGYLLALVSGAVLLLTGQPPWFLLTAVVALVVAFFLPRGLDITQSK